MSVVNTLNRESCNEMIAFFSEWEELNRDRFLLRMVPVSVHESESNWLRYRIDGVSSMLEIWVGSGEIFTNITYQNRCWDLLDNWYANPEQDESGKWFDPTLTSERSYCSQKDLYTHEVFEPFLKRLNERLSGIKPVLYLYQNRGTWASFEEEGANDLLIHCE